MFKKVNVMKQTRVVVFLVMLAFIGLSGKAQTQTVIVEETSEGTILRGAKLAAKLDWLPRNAESHNIYIIEVNANENVAPRTLEFKDAINITVILRGDSINRILRLASNGTMFTMRTNVTFVLDSNITLQGHPQNTGPMISVNGGIFKMKEGSTIIGNKSQDGVCVKQGSTFEMNGGNITNNGRGIENAGFFTMNAGIISDNSNTGKGGGVYNVGNLSDGYGTFTMNAGTISGNTAADGGGVFNRNIFIMNGGIISDNTATKSGGGVYDYSATFTMKGGTITGNTAAEYGGGVYEQWGSFTKTGSSIITGYNSDQTNGNVVRDKEGVLARRGHAVYSAPKKTSFFPKNLFYQAFSQV